MKKGVFDKGDIIQTSAREFAVIRNEFDSIVGVTSRGELKIKFYDVEFFPSIETAKHNMKNIGCGSYSESWLTKFKKVSSLRSENMHAW